MPNNVYMRNFDDPKGFVGNCNVFLFAYPDARKCCKEQQGFEQVAQPEYLRQNKVKLKKKLVKFLFNFIFCLK